ncbi:high-affinity octopamine transporter protein 1-like protein, partial [Dinothrombium tinctorium]
YDSLHSTPKQQKLQEEEKKLDSFEIEDLATVSKENDNTSVFLIPYCLMLIFTALPLFFLELSLGQFNKLGPITLWSKVCPSMKGVGYCCVLIAWYVSFYYNVIIGWTFYYIYITLTSGSPLPWAHCGNPWNTPDCFSIISVMNMNNQSCANSTDNENKTSSAVEFYKRGVLEIHKSTGLENMGSIRTPIVICVACVFVVLYFSLFKGVKSSGKVVWVTATAPYVILTILLIRGLYLPGAANDVLHADFLHLNIHFKLSDALITVAVNSLTSFYSGFVIFTYLGYMANNMCKKISEVAQEGYGLVFMVYPEAISTLPYSHVWALLFFVMLVTLGLDSAVKFFSLLRMYSNHMGGLEAVITGVMDELNLKRVKREHFTAVVLFLSFSMSLINTTQGGGYTMFWFDVYAATVALLCSALFEAVAVSYCYGLNRFCGDIKLMIDYYPSAYWRICWKFMSPLCLTSIVLLTVYEALSNPLSWENYQFPHWSIILGWAFSLLPVVFVPIVYIYHKIRERIHKPAVEASVDSRNEIIAVPPLKSPVYV